MDTIRTPDDRFAGLPDYDFEPHYVDIPDGDGASVRVHHVDEGPAAGPAVLLLHGEPSWSYLYRHMIPVLVDSGLRALAPDLVGFGKSDKPTDRNDYTFARHLDWARAHLFDALGLDEITLVGQDWGGLIGLRLVAESPERFARVVAANTFLPTGEQPPNDAFQAWRRFSQEVEEFRAGRIVDTGCATDLSPEVIAAYDAPFPDQRHVEGARQFPVLVPTEPDAPGAEDNRRAWKVLERFDKPFLTAFSDRDPIMSGGDRVFQRRVPGAAGQPHTVIEGAGHFLQEDKGPELARVVADFVSRT